MEYVRKIRGVKLTLLKNGQGPVMINVMCGPDGTQGAQTLRQYTSCTCEGVSNEINI
jgi:hypothetical protein